MDRSEVVDFHLSFTVDRKKEVKVFEVLVSEAEWLCSDSVVVLIRDTTDKKRQEREDIANHCKTLLLSSLSHELLTPLNAVIYPVNRAIELQSARQERYLAKAKVNALLLKYIIGDLLCFTQIDMRQFSLNKTWARLKEMVREVLTLI